MQLFRSIREGKTRGDSPGPYPQVDYKNFPYAGWLLQRDIGDQWTLGGEIFYHGPEGLAAPQTHSSTMSDVGGYYYFSKPAFQLLFSIGQAVAGQPESYAYLGLYWTWGKGGDDRSADNFGWSRTSGAPSQFSMP